MRWLVNVSLMDKCLSVSLGLVPQILQRSHSYTYKHHGENFYACSDIQYTLLSYICRHLKMTPLRYFFFFYCTESLQGFRIRLIPQKFFCFVFYLHYQDVSNYSLAPKYVN